jgi:hypothetical protein
MSTLERLALVEAAKGAKVIFCEDLASFEIRRPERYSVVEFRDPVQLSNEDFAQFKQQDSWATRDSKVTMY